MHEYKVHTLVDITENGNLKQAFPFKTISGEVVHDKTSLAVTRNQNSNFATVLQLLQMRANITWEIPPTRINQSVANMRFGSNYEGKQNSWHFQFFTEQSEVYGSSPDPIEFVTADFDLLELLQGSFEVAVLKHPHHFHVWISVRGDSFVHRTIFFK